MTVSRNEDSLNNPMRFSVRPRTIDIGELLRHTSFEDKVVTKIELEPGQLYVHWDWASDTEAVPKRSHGVTDD